MVSANTQPLQIDYKFSNVNICFKTCLLLVKDMNKEIILGTPFLALLYPFRIDEKWLKKGQDITFLKMKEWNILENNEVNLIKKEKQHIKFLSKEIRYKRIEENLLQKDIQTRIEKIKNQIETNLCFSIPNAFWNRNQHKVSLTYVDGFDESQILTKARPIQMNAQLFKYCKEEIKDLLDKNLIRNSQSPWSCGAFYVKKTLKKWKRCFETCLLTHNTKKLNQSWLEP